MPAIPLASEHATGGRLVDTSQRTLPLVSASVEARAAGGFARLVLRQRFHNAHPQPLAVTYSLPLPPDAVVGGFSFVVGDRRIVGEVDRRQAARERFEQALVEGHTAALLEQERSSLFTQELGNIPPGADLQAELVLDLRLRWLDEGAWELRFPTSAAPRYLGAPGRVTDAAAVTQDIADGPMSATFDLHVDIADSLAAGAAPMSPSHAIATESSDGALRVQLRGEGVVPDRDVVIRWPVAGMLPGIALQVARPSGAVGDKAAYGRLAIVPPARSANMSRVRRDLIVLLDTSGSMSGEPIGQAARVTAALIDTLGAEDTLELLAFSSSVSRWRKGAAPATQQNKAAAIAWLRALRASGGTEMRDGILAALQPMRKDSQRQVVLVTDGLIGFEQEIVRAIAEQLPAGSRVHTVGIGSSVNRTLTGGAARAGRGVEVIVGLGEDSEPAARRLVAATDCPVIVELEIGGSAVVSCAPARLPDLFLGAPARLGLELRPEGGDILVRGSSAAGVWEKRIHLEPVVRGDGESNDDIPRMVAREWVEDLESSIAAGEDSAAADARIEELGVRFQIATRLTSWVAVDSSPSVDPSQPIRRERMPHALPHGMSMEGLGLRSAMAPMGFGGFAGPPAMQCVSTGMRTKMMSAPSISTGARLLEQASRALGGIFQGRMRAHAEPASAAPPHDEKFDMPAAPAPSGPKPAAKGEVPKAKRRARMPAEEERDAKAVPQPIRCKGRIVLRKSGRIVIEVLLEPAGFAWQPPETAIVRWDDGSTSPVRLGAGTAAGWIPPGASIRLLLELDDEAFAGRNLKSVRLETESGTVEIDL